jgi:hypothetical protein
MGMLRDKSGRAALGDEQRRIKVGPKLALKPSELCRSPSLISDTAAREVSNRVKIFVQSLYRSLISVQDFVLLFGL